MISKAGVVRSKGGETHGGAGPARLGNGRGGGERQEEVEGRRQRKGEGQRELYGGVKEKRG